jgi:hypothetical protein
MSLVRSTLEYGSVIWTPYYKTHVDRLEKVQYRFFKFIRWKLPSQISYSYSLSLCYLGLATLDVRGKYRVIKKSLDQGCRGINKISYVIGFIRLVYI